MITNKPKKVKKNHQGSSFVSPAYGRSGTRATINYNSPAAEKKSGEARKQAGKKKKGCGENKFLPNKPVCQRQTRTRRRFRYSASAEYQNRKIFVSLIEKNCEGAIKKMFRKFLCFARRSRGERKR